MDGQITKTYCRTHNSCYVVKNKEANKSEFMVISTMESLFGTKLPIGTDCPVGFNCWGDTIVSTREDQATFVRRQNYTNCPLGFICSGNRVANCSLVQTLPLTLQLGNVHAGIYCPEGDKNYVECPSGFYCPNPVGIQRFFGRKVKLETGIIHGHCLNVVFFSHFFLAGNQIGMSRGKVLPPQGENAL